MGGSVWTLCGLLIVVSYSLVHGQSIAPPTGLYFQLNGVIYNDGASVLISDIGSQPADRSDRGSTLVCVTTNVNTACCRSRENNGVTNATAGAVGEWRYPNGNLVPRPNGDVVDFARFGYTHHVRLAKAKSDSTPPVGVYTCEVPSTSGVNVTATISLTDQVSTSPVASSAAPSTAIPTSSAPETTDTSTAPVTTESSSAPDTSSEPSSAPDTSSEPSSATDTSSEPSSATDTSSEPSSAPDTSSEPSSAPGTPSAPATAEMTTGGEIGATSAMSTPPVSEAPTSPPPLVVSLTAPGPALVESEVTLNCSSDVMGSFVWSNSSISDLSSAASVAISQDASGVFSVLTISSVLISHAGTYSCEVSAAGQSSTRSADLIVQLTSPVSVEAAAPLSLLGFPINLTCSVSVAAMLEPGVQVQVQWTDSSGGAVAGGTPAMASGTSYTSQLTLANTDESNVGVNYTCAASLVSTLAFINSSDTVSNSTTISLQIAAPIAVDVASSRNGGSTDLTCSITLSSSLPGGAALLVMWTGPSGTLIGTTPTGSGSSHTSVLSLSSLSASDAGTYTCNASIQSSRQHLISSTSLSGSTAIAIQIGAPSVTVSTSASLFSVGDSTSLTCAIMLVNDLIAGTSLEVNWTLPDNSVRMAGGSSDATLTGSGTSYESVLTTPTLSLSLAGTYNCSAMVSSTLPLTTNSEAVMDSSVVEVQAEAPSSVAIVTPSQSLLTGDGLFLQCDVMLMSVIATGTSLEVTWSLPNSSSVIAGFTGDATLVGGETAYTSNLTIPSLTASHAGVFYCSATVTSTLSYINSSSAMRDSMIVALQIRPPSSVTVSSSPSVIYEGTTFTLTCSIELFEEMSNLMILNVTWTGPAGATLTGTLSGSGTSYTSTSTASTTGSYTCSAMLVANSEYLSSSTETMNATTIVTVPAPSAPTLISATPQTTTISLTWTQPPGDVVDSYTISYTSTIDQCVGTVQFTSSDSVSGINGSMRSYSLTDLEEDSEYGITIEAVNRAGRATSAVLTSRISGAAPTATPVIRVTSATPTTISIAWNVIPCLMRNGMILRYIVSFCHVSVINCQSLTMVTDVSNRVLTFNNLIPRSSYNLAIRADSEDPLTFDLYTGSFSSPITASTAPPQDLDVFLNGVIYPPNVALDLTDIGIDGSSLRCLTPLTQCCRDSDNPNDNAFGSWIFPDGSIVPSRSSGEDISRTRGASSVLLHRINNVMSPTGVYTCEIPDNSTITRELNVYLYAGQLLDLATTLEFFRDMSQLICTVRGGLVSTFSWTRDGVVVSDSDLLFTQSLTLTNRSVVTSQLVLSSANISSLVGTYQCIVTDGNGRTSMVSQIINGVATRSSPVAPLTLGEAATLTCTNEVGQASLMEWQSENGTVLASATSSNMLDLTFGPVNDSLTIHGREFVCHVTRNGKNFNQSLSVTVGVPRSSVALSLLTQGSLVAGSELNVTCVIAGQTSGLTGSYMTSISAVSIPGSITTTSLEDRGESVLNINPLRTLNPTMYTCHGSYFSPAANRTLEYEDSLTIKVQISTPEVVLMEPSDSALIAGRDDDVTLTCSASVDRGVVDFGDLVYSFTWYNSEGEVIMSSSRTIISSINNMSTLTLSPLSVDDFNITCSVVVAERLGRLDSSSAAFQYTFINIRVPDPPAIEILSSGSSTAGEMYSLTCDVSLSQNLRQSPVIEWVGPDRNVIDITTLRDVTLTSSSPSTTMTLSFNPLRSSHRGMYWCRATLTDMDANIRLINNSSHPLIVQIPPPLVIIEGSPIDKGFHIGLLLTFSARITLSPAVDSPGDIEVASSWTSPRSANSTGAVSSSSSPISYYNDLTINLQDTVLDSGVYAVSFSIISLSSFLIGSDVNGSRDISVEPFPPQRVTVLEEVRVTAGGEASLLCNAVRQDTLSSSTLLEIFWLDERNEVISSTSGLISGPTSSNATNITSRLTMSNIITSQAGVYTCVVNMTIPGVVEDHQVIETSSIFVYIPPATSVYLSGSRPGPLYWGTSLTLTCIVNYDTQLVDTPVSFYINITGPQTNSVTTNTTANVSTATFNPLLPVHNGSYVCSSSISPSSESLFVLPSMSASSSLLDLVLTELPVPVVGVSSAAVAEAGQFPSLTCRVDVVEYLTVDVQVEWRQPDGSMVSNTGNPSIIDGVEVMGRVSTLNVSFSPLLTSHAGEYQCFASITIPSVPQPFSNNDSVGVYINIPRPVISLRIDASTVQGTVASLISSTVLDMLVVDSPIELTGSWSRQDGGTAYNQVATAMESNRQQSPYTNSLQFSPLRSDSVDGGDYIFTVNISSLNSRFVLPVVSSGNISVVVSNYPELNIATAVNVEECQPENGAKLSANVSLLSNTFSDRNVSFVWTREANEISREEGPNMFIGSYMLADITESTMGRYNVEICLTIFGSGLQNHCSDTSFEIIATDPEVVSDLKCATESNSLSISWSPPSGSSVAMYRVNVQEIVAAGTNMVRDQDLNPPFVKELSSLGVVSPVLVMTTPYKVSVSTLNSARCEITTEIICFTKEGVPEKMPGNVMVRRDSEDNTVLLVSWEPLTIVEARGFITYEVMATPSSGSRKRQQQQALMTSVPYNMSMARLEGAAPGVSYAVQVTPRTSSQESGPGSVVATEEPLPSDSSSVVVIAVVVVVVLFILILIAVIVLILFFWYRNRTPKKGLYSPGHYATSVTPGSNPYDSMELKYKDEPLDNNGLGKEMEAAMSSEVVPDEEPVPVSVAPLEVMDRMKPVSLDSFRDHVRSKHDERDKGFETEYQSFGSDPVSPHTVAKLPHNRVKNRFANIFPYDSSRVKLSAVPEVEGSDYINACTIDGYSRSGSYIAAQGPMPNTEADFWRMIWEMKLSNIVMLTKCMEAGRRKCEQYWGENMGEVYESPDKMFKVTTTSVMQFADYVIRTFVLRRSGETEELKVSQYHFVSWPDHGVPKFATSLLSFIRRVQKEHNKDLGVPLLVHCSAGVGRTGTFITLDAMLERIRSEESVSAYEFVKNMRQRRVLMVQTMAQYVFIHDALNEFITCGDTEIKANSLRAKVNFLSKVVPGKGVTGFNHQFQLLEQSSRVPLEEDCSDAAEHYNRDKNRYPDKPPYNLSRARIRPSGEEGSEYINASFIDGYKQRNTYIATQGPLSNTVNDLWRMIWEFKSKTLVTLCQPMERSVEVCHPFWPSTESESKKYGKITVTLQSSTNFEHFEVRKFLLNDDRTASTTSRSDTNFILTQFHHLTWPEDGSPSTGTLIEMLDMITKTQMNTGNRPITVMCNDGVGRSGTFLCIHSQLERLKTEGVVDMFQAVKSARIQRGYLMPDTHQYAYAHQVLADYMDKFDNYANFKDMI